MLMYQTPLTFDELAMTRQCVELQKSRLERLLGEFPHLRELFVVELRNLDRILKRIKQTMEGAEWGES